MLRNNLQVELDCLTTNLEKHIKQERESQTLKQKDELDKVNASGLEVLHSQAMSSTVKAADTSNPAQRGHDRANSLPPRAAEPSEVRPRKAVSRTRPRPALLPVHNEDNDDSDGPTVVELLNASRRHKASEASALKGPRPAKKVKLHEDSEVECLGAQKVNSTNTGGQHTFHINDISGNTADRSQGNIQAFHVQHLQFVDRDPESNVLKSVSEWHSSRFEPNMGLRLHGDSFRPYTNKYCDDDQPDWVIDPRSVVELLCNPNNALVSMKRAARGASSPQWHSRDVWVQFKDVQNMDGFVKCCRGRRAGELVVIKWVSFLST